MSMKLSEVLWVPELKANLISVNKLTKDGFIVTFDKDHIYLKNGQTYNVIGKANGNQYQLVARRNDGCMPAASNDDEEKLCSHEWHKRFAHRNLADVKLHKKIGLQFKKCNCNDQCEDCLVGKMARKPFPKKGTQATERLGRIVSDVCGWMQVESLGRKKYFVTFIDEYSKHCTVKFLREKSEVADATIQHIERMKNQLGIKPKAFRSDRGTEYLCEKLQWYLKIEGIDFETTVGYCPEQNGMAERKNRTLVEAARTMMNDAKLPMYLWAEAVDTANHVQNRLVNRETLKSPFEILFNKKPRYEQLRRFGCDAYVKIPDEKRRKLNNKATMMKFVGYDEQSKGFRLFDGRKIVISREVTFVERNKKDETELNGWGDFEIDLDLIEPLKSNGSELKTAERHEPETASGGEQSPTHAKEDEDEFISAESGSDGSEVEEDVVGEDGLNPNEVQEEPLPPSPPSPQVQTPRRTTRAGAGQRQASQNPYATYDPNVSRDQRRPYVRKNDRAQWVNHQSFDEFSMKCDEMFAANATEGDEKWEPRTYRQAVNSTNAEKWIEVMNEELKSIEDSGTWEVVNPPLGRNVIGSKWVFKVKLDNEGKLIRHKARLSSRSRILAKVWRRLR
jgi:transposase InsO family protein